MLRYTLFGESHGPVVGVLLEGVPAGLRLDDDFIAAQLLRRQSGGETATARREADIPTYLSGVFRGCTTGDPLVAVFYNRDTRPGDYEALRNTPRPGHADYAAWVKSRGFNDYRGGGRHSGRLTAPLVAAGAIAQTLLRERGITVSAHVAAEDALREKAKAAKAAGDSVGGCVCCTVTGLPAGLGGFGWAEAADSELARHLFAIPGVKAVGFGAGEAFADMRGSAANDALHMERGRPVYTTNRSGGVSGGITTGMPLVCTVTFRPTPSIAKEQPTVDLSAGEDTTLTVTGRHDACIALRAAPVVEAAAALALAELLPPEDDLTDLRRELDAIDRELVGLFARRMDMAGRIGAYKRAHGLAVQDPAREEEVLQSRGELLPERRAQVRRLYELLLALSREEQA